MANPVKSESFFDYSPEEQYDIIETATHESNRMQKEFMEKPAISRQNWKALYRKKTLGTPRDKDVEAFIEELVRAIDAERANKG